MLNGLSAELAVHRAQRIDTTYTRLSPMSTPDVCKLTLLLAHDIVSDVRQSFNLEQVEQGVAALAEAGRILIMGWPDSAVNAVDAQAKFSRTGIPVTCATDVVTRGRVLKALQADDLLLLYPCSDALPEAEAARRQMSAAGGTSLTITVDEQQHAAVAGGLMLAAQLKGHLREYGDMDRTLANSVLTAMLYLCMVSQQAGAVAGEQLAQA